MPSAIGDAIAARSRAAGPTMSPSTAPASTEASWSGSPTRIRRASVADGGDELGHHRRRDHRRLVDDDHVVGQPVAGVVAEAAAVPGRQPSSRCSVDAGVASRRARTSAADVHRRAPRRGRPPRGGPRPCRSERRGRRAAGGGPPPWPARRAGRRSAPPSSSCRCPARRRRRRTRGRTAVAAAARWSVVAPGPNSRSSPAASTAVVDRRGRGRRAGGEAGGDRQLLAPVAVEVQACALEAQRSPVGAVATATSGLAATAASHAAGVGPRQGSEVDGVVIELASSPCRGRSVRSTHDVGRAAARARRAATASRTTSSVSPAERAEAPRRRGRRRRAARRRR